MISFLTSDSGRQFNRFDMALAEDLANRAAVAIENGRLYSELREADERKDQFLAMLAHELRNPLAAIGGGLQLMRMPDAPHEVLSEVQDTLERQFQHLVRMVDDLLDVSRVMRGKVELRPERIPLADVVARAVETARPLIEAERHTLELQLPSDSVELHVDPIRFAQILANLLNNAAKYTDPGGHIVVAAACEEDRVRIAVRDNGLGIPPDMLEQVFDLFTQSHHGLHRAQGGLGIGLTLVKRFVELHGGTISAHSAGVGQGSEFVIELPVADGCPTDPAAASPQADHPPEPQKILVVDDNADGAQMLAMLLRSNQHEVQVAASGGAALELAATFRPQIVILDLGMPDMDGYEVARRLRALPEGRELLLVALTGWGGSEERRRTAEAGFDYHLVKPVRAEQLRQMTARRGG